LNGFLHKPSDYNDPDRVRWIRNRPFAGASIRQITHFSQEISNHRFCSFNNGADYNLGKISQVPVAFFVGNEDPLANPTDTKWAWD